MAFGRDSTCGPGCPSIGVEVIDCVAEEICATVEKEGDVSTWSSFRHMNWLHKLTRLIIERVNTSMPSGPPPWGRVVSFNAVRTLNGTIGYNLRTRQVSPGKENPIIGRVKERDTFVQAVLQIFHTFQVLISRSSILPQSVQHFLPQLPINLHHYFNPSKQALKDIRKPHEIE